MIITQVIVQLPGGTSVDEFSAQVEAAQKIIREIQAFDRALSEEPQDRLSKPVTSKELRQGLRDIAKAAGIEKAIALPPL